MVCAGDVASAKDCCTGVHRIRMRASQPVQRYNVQSQLSSAPVPDARGIYAVVFASPITRYLQL
jgi:hypothetical protein